MQDLCDIKIGTLIKKSDYKNKDNSELIYPVYGGGDITFYVDVYNRDGTNIIISKTGLSK